jgi:hypothetical protein
MAFEIDTLKAEITQGSGMAIGNLYHVQLPTFTAQNLDITVPSMSLLCKAATLPGRQILSADKQMGIYNTKIAYGFAAEDVTLTFYALNDFEIRKYFEVWQAAAVNHLTGEVGYLDEYTAPVTISHLKKEVAFPIFKKKLFDTSKVPAFIRGRLPRIGPLDLAQGEFDLDLFAGGGITYSLTLNKAYPTTLQAIELGNEGQLLEITVQLSYKNWESKTKGRPSLTEEITGSLLGELLGRL